MMKLVAGVLALLALLLTGGVLYVQYGDMKSAVEWTVGRFSDRALRIDGRFELELFPEPTLVAERLTLANASWGSEPDMLHVAHVSVRVGLWSTISAPLRVRELRARDVRVLVESGVDGRSNWALSEPGELAETGAEPAAPASFEMPVLVEAADLQGLRVTVRQPAAPDRAFHLESLEAHLDDAGHQRASAKGDVLTLPVTIEADAGPLTPRRADQPIDLDLSGSLGGLSFDASGALGAGAELIVNASADELSSLAGAMDVELPFQGPFRIDATITGAQGGIELIADTRVDEVDAHWQVEVSGSDIMFDAQLADLQSLGRALDVGRLPATGLRLSGRAITSADGLELRDTSITVADARANLNGAARAGSIRIQADASGPRLSDLGFDLPAIPFKMALTANVGDDTLQIDPLHLTFAESDLGGTLAVSQTRPLAVQGRLTSELLDLSPFLADGPQKPDAENTSISAENPQAELVFDDEPLALEGLRSGSIDLGVTIARLQLGETRLNEVVAGVDLKAGQLDATLRLLADAGGTVQGDASLDAAGELADLRARLYARELRLGILSDASWDADQVPPLDVTLEIDATGRSQRDLAASASGRLLFTQGAGRISNTPLPWLSGDVLAQLASALNPFARRDPYTELNCSAARLELDQGMGTVPVMLMQTRKIKVIGKGTVDLHHEALNLEFNTQPREGIGISADTFVTPYVNLAGTLSNPRLGINEKGVLLHGGAAVLTGGLSVLAEAALDRVEGATDTCAQALHQVGEHPPLER